MEESTLSLILSSVLLGKVNQRGVSSLGQVRRGLLRMKCHMLSEEPNFTVAVLPFGYLGAAEMSPRGLVVRMVSCR